MKLKTLYRKTQRGSVSFKELYTRKMPGKNVYVKYTKTGILGSSKFKVSNITVDKGKNIGKKNETTVQQQAEKELLSTWNSSFSEGYKDDLAYVQSTVYNTFKDKSVMPMLLNPHKESKEGFSEGYAQRKYDGVRCIAEKHNGVIRLKSREGKVFNLPRILESVTTIMEEQLDQTLDGELYIHGVELHDIISLVKNNDPNMKLEYHIYDVAIKNLQFNQRRNLLLALDVSSLSNIYVDTGVPVKNEEELKAFHKESLDKGFEGTIVCDPDAEYDFGFRTNSKGKKKPRVTSEFECIDQYYNKGKYSKQTTLICRNKKGETFHVKLKGTDQQREEWAATFEEKVKGKMITVEYRKLTKKKKVPMEGVGVAIRDYE